MIMSGGPLCGVGPITILLPPMPEPKIGYCQNGCCVCPPAGVNPRGFMPARACPCLLTFLRAIASRALRSYVMWCPLASTTAAPYLFTRDRSRSAAFAIPDAPVTRRPAMTSFCTTRRQDEGWISFILIGCGAGGVLGGEALLNLGIVGPGGFMSKYWAAPYTRRLRLRLVKYARKS